MFYDLAALVGLLLFALGFVLPAPTAVRIGAVVAFALAVVFALLGR